MSVRAIVALSLCVSLFGCAEPKSGDDRLKRDAGRDGGGASDGGGAGDQDAAMPRGGLGWTSLESGTEAVLTSAHFLDAKEGWIAGLDTTLQHTANSGKSWDVVAPLGIDAQSGFTAIQFLDDQVGWAAGPGIVVRTLDGGASWHGWDNSDHRAGTPSYDGLFALSSTTAWTAGGTRQHPNVPSCETETTSCPTLWFTRMPVMTGPRQTRQHLIDRANLFNDVFFASVAVGYAVGNEGYILRVSNAATGADLMLATQDAQVTEDLHAVFMLDEQTAWAVGNNGVILHTANGKDWSRQPTGVTLDLSDVQFVDAKNGWVAGARGTILRTTNGGEAWTQTPTGISVKLNALSFPTPDVGFAVGEHGTVLKWSGEVER